MKLSAILIDPKIQKGSTVKYKDGYYRVTARFHRNKTVNLGQIFGSKIYHRSVSLTEVTEAYDEWHKRWTQSETYRCM